VTLFFAAPGDTNLSDATAGKVVNDETGAVIHARTAQIPARTCVISMWHQQHCDVIEK